MTYFHRLAKLTRTRLWINNPTRLEADLAIAEGATGCTFNPSYSQKMLDHPEESAHAWEVMDSVIRTVADDEKAVAEFQRRMARPICDKFVPVFEDSNHQEGFVSIQGDPFREHDPSFIIDEARENLRVAPNICCKIPTTWSGLKAMEILISEMVPINATEIFAVQQGLDVGELYERLAPKGRPGPKLYYSHIAGVYDEYLHDYAQCNQIKISPGLLAQAGLIISRKLYMMVKEAGYPISFVGGGARALHHFTELVGGEVNLTVNWKGIADVLLEQNPFVVNRMFNAVPHMIIDELIEKLPDFKRGYLVNGIKVEDYNDFGPVKLFRQSFVNSWKRVVDLIKERRLAISN